MNCPKCGTFNNEGSNFCIKCGQSIIASQPVQSTLESTVIPQEQQSIVNEQVAQMSQPSPILNNNQVVNNTVSNSNVDIMAYLTMIITFILKPFTAIKEHVNKFDNIKVPAITALVISGLSTIINLITSIIDVVKVEDYSWLTGKTTTTWVWDNLKEFNFIGIIGKNFLIYLGAIVAIATLYYIATLIAKKQVNFSRLLGISTVSVIPALICWLVISPIISMIYALLGMVVMIAGFVYSIIIMYEGINNEIALEGNMKFYINMVCLSILAVAAYYLCINLFMSSVTSELGGLLNMFK